MTISDYKNRKFTIYPYNDGWSDRFTQYKATIQEIFDDATIEHIGSTTVAGMSGKDSIDVLVVVKNLEVLAKRVKKMEQAGFADSGQVVMDNSRLFRIMKNDELVANIHFFPENHPHIENMITLRNYLRAHPYEVEKYSQLKLDLYKVHKNDYTSYRKLKDEYMCCLMGRVRSAPSESL